MTATAKLYRTDDKITVVLEGFPLESQQAGVAQAEARRLMNSEEYPGRARRVTRGFTVWEVRVVKTKPMQ